MLVPSSGMEPMPPAVEVQIYSFSKKFIQIHS